MSSPPLELPSEFFPLDLFDYEDTGVTQSQNLVSSAVFLIDLNKRKMPMVSISAEQKVNAVLYKYEHQNARAAQKATAATTNAAAVEELRMVQ